MSINIVEIDGIVKKSNKGQYTKNDGNIGNYLTLSLYHKSDRNSLYLNCVAFDEIIDKIESKIILNANITVKGELTSRKGKKDNKYHTSLKILEIK